MNGLQNKLSIFFSINLIKSVPYGNYDNSTLDLITPDEMFMPQIPIFFGMQTANIPLNSDLLRTMNQYHSHLFSQTYLEVKENTVFLFRHPRLQALREESCKGELDGCASRDAACPAGGLGSIPGPGQTYV
jgi:hypothetical protein